MIDFNLDIEAEAQSHHFLFFLFFYLLTFFSNKTLVNSPYTKNRKKEGTHILYFSMILLTIVNVVSGDFYHYANIIQSGAEEGHMEPIYYWLSSVLNNNYLIWRIVVWGTALILVYLTFRRLQLDMPYAILIFFLCYTYLFSYARVSLACAIYFYGLTLIIKPNRPKILSYLAGGVIIWCSHYFHSSVYFLIALTPLILIPINKYTTWVSLFIIIATAGVAYQFFLNNIFSLVGSEDYADSFLAYSEREKAIIAAGISGFTSSILTYGSFIIPIIILTKRLIMSNIVTETSTHLLYKMAAYIVAFAFVMGTLTQTAYFFYRLLYMSIIPISALLAYTFQNNIISLKEFKICIYWGIIDILFTILYGFYLETIAN